MAQQDKPTFETTFNNTINGLFKDNTTGLIDADDMRTLVRNIKDSFLGIVDDVLDEDSMVSDSASKVPSQQSVRAYVTAIVAAIVEDAIVQGVTSKAPSQNIVFEELALKATIQYVDDVASGIVSFWKDAADVATTANITLSGEQTIDGILTSGSRILVKNQNTQTQNGIYVTAAGAWSRAADADQDDELENIAITVLQGDTQANTNWLQTTGSVIIGVSSISWVPLGSSAPDASPTVKGVSRLYTATGSNTDGSITQNAITNAIATVQTNLNTHGALTNNPHSVTKAQVGLSDVNNTADSAKPVSTAQQTALDTKQGKDDFVDNEIPAGNINSINQVFTLLNTPVVGSVKVYMNGLRFRNTQDYTISGNTLTMIQAPQAGDTLLIDYRK